MAKVDKNKVAAPAIISSKVYFIIAFIEGGAVMAIELLGAKMVAPFYGASLYVWTSIFITTLGGLAAGYFIGGRAVARIKKENLLFIVLFTGSVFIALMPIIAPLIMEATFSLGLRVGSLISCIAFMMVPLICMGMVSPIIIEQASHELKIAGKTAGTVYAVSTVGGIIATLLLGFFIIPDFGIKKPILVTAAILGICPLIYFLARRKKIPAIVSIVVFILLASFSKSSPVSSGEEKIQYYSEGLLGQIMVMDVPVAFRGTQQIQRRLFVNRIVQSFTLLGLKGSLWAYPHRISILASIKPVGSKALVMGYGAGSIARELLGLGFETKAVELDKRIKEVAKKFFFADEKRCPVIIDDARHYMRTSKEKFDVIVFDLLRGEEQPSYVFTKESFTELKKMLNDNALVIVNFQGEIKGPLGLAARSVYRTLKESGYDTGYSVSEDSSSQGTNDILFFASQKKLPDFSKLSQERVNACCHKALNSKGSTPLDKMISEIPINVSDAFILTDDKPILETINNPTLELWRSSNTKDLTIPLIEAGIPLFK